MTIQLAAAGIAGGDPRFFVAVLPWTAVAVAAVTSSAVVAPAGWGEEVDGISVTRSASL